MHPWNKPVGMSPVNAESLADVPSGGRGTMWVAGVILALVPVCYGIRCIAARHATLFGSRGSQLELHVAAAVSLGIAYITLGAFAHFHWFWGLHPRLQLYSHLGKILSLLVFLPAFGYTICRAFASFAM